jgi:tRNA-specific 2-thiouridylase
MPAIRAIGLLSGGLDSALAARLLIDQGIEVIGLHLESPTACRNDVRMVAHDLGLELVVRPKGQEYLRLLRNPKWGYGKNMNPCIDCRMFMFQLGRPYLEEFGAQFLFTGEVVGQRPMSQTRNSIFLIDREVGMEGWILRPLSARILPQTEPERRGWVDRSRLLGICGRGRTEQLELAERFGLKGYQSPGGGCLLTDPIFSTKLRDLFEHTPEAETDLSDVALLRLGRHFRISPELKIVLGRNAEENRRLAGFAGPQRWLIEPMSFNGPNALVCGAHNEIALSEAIALIGRYTRDPDPGWRVRWREGEGWESRALGAPAAVGVTVGPEAP